MAFFAILMILTAGTAVGCGTSDELPENDGAADMIIYGTIYTADGEDRIVEAAAVKDGRFVYVGDSAGAEEWSGEGTEMIEAGDGMVLPAFMDGHAHGQEGGVGSLFEVNLYEGESMEDYLEAVRIFLAENPDVEFLLGSGWINGYTPDGGPTSTSLDEIVDDIPIMLTSGDHHSIWANSKALELAGIDRDTEDVAGGVIERYDDGMPSGTFRENAQNLLDGVVPDYTVEQYKEGILAYQNEVKEYGITAYFEPMVNLGGGDNLLKAYNELDQEGRLILRVYGGYQITAENNPLEELEQCAQIMEETKGGNFEVTAIKLFIDGVIEGKTAYLLDVYESDLGFRGEPLWEQEFLNQVCAKADELGIQIHTHAIGDAAVKMILDAYEYVNEKNGESELRHAITHLQIVAPEDIQRMADLNVVAVINSYWFCKEPGYFYELEVPYLGEERANEEYPAKSFVNTGAIVTLASDYPVTIPSMPLEAIQKAVTRTDLDGDLDTLLNPDEQMDILNSLRGATINIAYQNHGETDTGSIETGKSADFILLDKNIIEIDPYQIIDANVMKTVFRGEEIFRR